MTSQKSTNNKSICLLSLMREDLRHKNWMTALSILGSMLAGPIAFLFYYSGQRRYDYSQYVIQGDKVFQPGGRFYVMTTAELYNRKLSSCLDYLNDYFILMMIAVAFLGALIVGIFGFYYLYHKKMVDLYHSAPVSRTKLFMAVWMNGILLWLVPALIASILVFIESAVFMQGMFIATLFWTVFKLLLRMALIFFIVYHACLVAVMLSGNLLNAIVGSLTYGFLVAAIVFITIMMQRDFYENFYLPENLIYFHPLYVLSPFVTPFALVYHWFSSTTHVTSWPVHLFGGILLQLINLCAAYLLYLRRPSELSERGLESKGVRVFLRFVLSLVGGAACTMILYTTTYGNVAWMLLGAFFGTALVFCLLNGIYHGSFKEVFSHKIQYGVAALTCVFWIATIYYDWTGYDRLLPSKSDIKSISIYAECNNDSDSRFVYKNNNVRGPVRGYNDPSDSFIYEDAANIYDLLYACVHSGDDSQIGGYFITAKINTKWGTYYRQYILDEDKISYLAPIVESEEYLKAYHPVKSLEFGYPNEITITSSFSKDEVITDKERIKQLVDCLHQDFTDHSSMKDLMRSSRLFSIALEYGESTAYNNTHTFYYEIPYWYTRTIDLVESWYANKKWDPSIDDITAFNLCNSIAVGKNQTIRDAVLREYGYEADGTPMSTAPDAPTYQETFCLPWANWSMPLKDLTILEKLSPYLIWGSYSDTLTLEYTQLGWAELNYGGTVYCYIQYGKLPLDILESFPPNADITAPYMDYEEEEFYYSEPVYD